MAGLDPAIHAFLTNRSKDVDARDKPGHGGKSVDPNRLADIFS
jgi:hypothetical protein